MCRQVGAVVNLAVEVGVNIHLRCGEGKVRNVSAQLCGSLCHQRGMECTGYRKRERTACACSLAVFDRLCESRLFTCDNQLTRAVIVYRTNHAGGHLRAGFFNYAVLQTEDSCHAAVDRVCCLLHQLAAHGNDLHAVCEGNNACSRQCGVFTEREACRCLEFHACFLQCSPGCHGMGENRDLAVLRAGERCLVALKAQLGYIQTGAFACFLKNQLGSLRVLIKILAHAGGLCALTREKCKTVVHVSFLQNNNQTLTAPYFNRYSSHKVLLNNNGLS